MSRSKYPRYAVGQFFTGDIHGAKYAPKAYDGDFEYSINRNI